MFHIKIDADLALVILGVFAVIVIVGTILFVSRQLGIQTYSVFQVGTPCNKAVFCNQRYPAAEIGRDVQRGIAYCQCENGRITQARLFS